MTKPKTTLQAQRETANTLYELDEHTRDLEVLASETELIVLQGEISSQLSDDICVWDDEAEDWTPSSKIYLDAYIQDTPEGRDLEQLDIIYDECRRNGMDDRSLKLIDDARRKFNNKKFLILPWARLFRMPRFMYVFFYGAFFGLVQLSLTIVVWIAMLYGIYWLIVKLHLNMTHYLR